MRKTTTILTLTAAIALAATGCSSTPANTPQQAQPSTVTKASAPNATEAFANLTVPTAKLGTIVTAANDKNSLLGRPGQYTSKITFTDSRVPASRILDNDNDSIERGGSIEVFATEADARKRADYIAKVTSGAALLAEYDYQHGTILIRVSRHLTPAQATEYNTATR